MNFARAAALVVLAALMLAACGEKKETLGDPTANFAPGVKATKPPWKPEYAHLRQRIAKLGLPPVGKEQVHHHALLHIYNDGILIQVQPNVGWNPPQKVFSSIHTHDSSGIVHMESERPHAFRLGDFFTIWGVPFGKKTLGTLRAKGDKQLHVYVNGKAVSNPVHYVLRDGDSVAVGYGTAGSFPHNPDKSALKTVSGNAGKQATCSKGKDGKPAKSCVKGATQ